jgi:hypothetical protein
MQQRGCEAVQLLISKYADNEATDAERQRVDNHVAACEQCARALREHMEVSAIFSTADRRAPDPRLRVGLYHEINRLKEEESRKQRRAREERPWYLPAPAESAHRPRNRVARLWSAASPFAVAALAVLVFLGATALLDKSPVVEKPARESTDVYWPPVPTIPQPVQSDASVESTNGEVFPPPVSTKFVDAMFSPVALASSTVFPTAVVGQDAVLRLSRPTPVLEEGNPTRKSDWHVLRDPAYGYSVAYPPNWWTHFSDQTRYFFPWESGGTSYAPYWIELRVGPNTEGYTPETANAALFGGKATVVRDKRHGEAAWVRDLGTDADNNSYDALYSFDEKHTYELRLTVPRESASGDFQVRLSESGELFSIMSGTFSPASLSSQAAGSYSPVLFLNGTGLSAVAPGGERQWDIARGGYIVRQFALSPDMRTVAFTSSRNPDDLWAGHIYLSRIDPSGSSTPTPLWMDEGLEIRDVAWYGDRELLAIAQSRKDGFGIFRIMVPRETANAAAGPDEVSLIATLHGEMFGAQGLAVSPDRQLITFLAPLGSNEGTDLYALRPDGSDLQRLVSHSQPSSPVETNGNRALQPDSQAIKSYLWTEGRLEYGGYKFNLLFTCGNASSPTFYRGGYLYSAPGATHPLLDPATLGVLDPSKVQIVHLAYSPGGKLAMTGYYTDRNFMADQLAGLWTADVAGGRLTNLKSLRIPAARHGITDLRWTPDGNSLIYRETMPQDAGVLSARYDGRSPMPFNMVRLDPTTGKTTILYSAATR